MTNMDHRKKNAIEALVKLADGMDGKSETAKIREVIDSIELALSSGVHREKVFDTLRESLGIKMNFRTFETTLHRIRKKRKQDNIKPNNNFPVSITAIDTGNQLVPHTHNNINNTSLIVSPSVGEYRDIDLANEENDNENNGEPKSSELAFGRNMNKALDYEELDEMLIKYRKEQKEKKKREKELEKRKN